MYRRDVDRARVPRNLLDTADLVAGLFDDARRGSALAWLRALEPYGDEGFLITHYGLLGDADGAFRVAERFDLVDDAHYHYQLCNIWSPRTASIRADPRFGALMQRWGFVDYWKRFGVSEYCSIADGTTRCR